MKRHAVIISNPGEEGDDNYCAGVLKDVSNYQSFLASPYGGLWYSSEIKAIHRPTVKELRSEISTWSTYGYVFVLFTGHGWFSTTLKSTCLQLKEGQEIDSKELRMKSGKQTIILDCCRDPHVSVPVAKALLERLAAAARPKMNPQDCRTCFERWLDKCADELVVMNACSEGQKAGDHPTNGAFYASGLIDATMEWANNNTTDTSTKYEIFSVVSAHNAAAKSVEELRGTRQTPVIEKAKSGPYFPFGIVA